MSGTEDAANTPNPGDAGPGALPSMEDLLNRSGTDADGGGGAGQPSTTTEPEPAPAATGEQDQGDRARDASGRFVPKPDAAAPPAAETGSNGVPLTALKDERGKRQAAEADAATLRTELDSLRARMAALEKPPAAGPAPAPEPARPPPHPIDDPEGYAAYQQEQQWNLHLNMSEAMLRQSGKTDVDERRDIFLAAARENPALLATLRRQVHPWDWMYQEAGRLKFLKEIGSDPDAYRARIEAELTEKLNRPADPAAPAPATPSTPALPTSLAAARNVGGRTPTEPAGPEPIEELLRFKG